MNPSTPNPQLSAIYRRVSTDHQEGSLAVQETKVTDYCRYQKLAIDDAFTFSDPDVSGSIPMADRAGGCALLNRLKLGDIKHLVVAKLDRLGRNTRDFLTVLDALNDLGVTLHIVDFGGNTITTNGIFGRMMLTIVSAFAEAELGQIRERVQQRADHKFANHELTGNVPFGFDGRYTFADGHAERRNIAIGAVELQRLAEEHGAVTSKRLVDNPTEQKWIRDMREWRSVYQRSLKSIADQLNLARVPSKQGKRWQSGNVDRVLNSRHTARLLQTPAASPSPLNGERDGVRGVANPTRALDQAA